MLGKTNITTLSEGAIITEVEDFQWIQMQSGIYGNFVKAIYKNNYLAAITADGTVAYTTDGEVWNTSVLEYENCKLNDIEWDGSRFILVGKYTDSTADTGLILYTTDFEVFAKISIADSSKEYLYVFPYNSNYILVTSDAGILYTDLTEVSNRTSLKGYYNNTLLGISASKNTEGIVIYTQEREEGGNASHRHKLYKINGETVYLLKTYDYNGSYPLISLLECKGAIYTTGLLSEVDYKIEKVTGTNEVMTMCTGQNFMFVDGAYFNSCQLFINNHEMLVVKKGESIADKTLDDLIEVAPELTVNCITKAFGRLFIFGNQGVILKSSAETNNEEAVTVQTISAKKALADAKQYTDEKYAALEARIAALERTITG